MTPSVSESTKTVSRPPFRKDIEGLRGIAVLLVVLYHAGVPGFAGGYIGVDVFFVLSGYLITGILVAEVVRTGTIDLRRFYARRARRLLPAMAVLLVAVSGFAFFFYAPLEQQPISKTAIATAAYVSNFYFARNATDYLAADAETNPLLHTWSLSVEEQFYFVWPALVLIALIGLRWKVNAPTSVSHRRLIWAMVAVSVASFCLTVYLMGTSRTHWAFFSSPTRAWEFAIGGLAALVPRVGIGIRAGDLRNARFRFGSLDQVPKAARILGWIGLVAVLVSAVAYSSQTVFPGFAAILPTLGTVFALRAGTARTDTSLAKFLAWQPLQVMGRLSYSWYLWHWPVLVFAAGTLGHLSLSTRVAFAAASLVLAEASYRFVENPVRHHGFFAGRSRRGLALAATLTIFGVGLGFGWRLISDQASRLPDQVRYTSIVNDRPTIYQTGCISDYSETSVADCVSGNESAERTIVLFGDSHAAQWEPALTSLIEGGEWRLVSVLKSACPVASVDFVYPALGREYTECTTWRRAALNKIAAIEPDVVFAASSVGYDVDASVWGEGMTRTLSALSMSSKSVVLLKDNPRPGFNVPACLARRSWQRARLPFMESAACDFDPRDDTREAKFDAENQSARAFNNVTYIDLTETICEGERCSAISRGDVVYRDTNHLAAAFVQRLSPTIAEVVHSAATRESQDIIPASDIDPTTNSLD